MGYGTRAKTEREGKTRNYIAMLVTLVSLSGKEKCYVSNLFTTCRLKMCDIISLTYDEYLGGIVENFKKLLDNNVLLDCTISVEGQFLKAHKIVLSACSPYFESLFCQVGEQYPTIILPEISYNILKAIIQFIYSGKVSIPRKDLADVLKCAEMLQIMGLGGGRSIVELTNDDNTVQSVTENQEVWHQSKIEDDVQVIGFKTTCSPEPVIVAVESMSQEAAAGAVLTVPRRPRARPPSLS
ncbi:LOW QUALITY PROTEIN: Protein roadkill, partial [Gryllus bimaculatus]